MRSPMFSILMVSLNPGDKLVETVKSVAKQTYTDYEVIVKDGGSRDGSLEALREYLAGQKHLLWRDGAPDCPEGAGFAEGEATKQGVGFADGETVKQRASFAEGETAGQRGAAADKRPSVRILEQPDTGIYEGMNQATLQARGEYLYFLNCGDKFASEAALEQAAAEIGRVAGRQERSHEDTVQEKDMPKIFYGDIFDALRGQVVASNPHMDDFACYRNVPCHQACIYHHSLFAERGYKPEYRVRADYEHFLWCYFCRDARPQYIPVTLSSYEGGGFSETPENRKRSAREHREITARYMGRGQRIKYRMILLLTLAPLRTKMAESPAWSGLYNRCKKMLYRR